MDKNTLESNSLQEEDIEHFNAYWAIYIACIIFIVVGVIAYNSGSHALKSPDSKIESKINFIVGFLVYIGVIVSFLGVIFQNRYRINIEVLSKNRQDWINDLRKNLADIMTIVHDALYVLSDEFVGNHQLKNEDCTILQMERIARSEREFNQRYYYIRLLLSVSQQKEGVDEQLSKRLIQVIETIKKQVFDLEERQNLIEELKLTHKNEILAGSLEYNEAIDELLENLVIQSEEIIKREWRKVKKGV